MQRYNFQKLVTHKKSYGGKVSTIFYKNVPTDGAHKFGCLVS